MPSGSMRESVRHRFAAGYVEAEEAFRAYSSHRERRFQSKLNSESGEAERSSKR